MGSYLNTDYNNICNICSSTDTIEYPNTWNRRTPPLDVENYNYNYNDNSVELLIIDD